MSDNTTTVTLRAEHAIELVELLEFLQDWIGRHHTHGPQTLKLPEGYDANELYDDLARFVFLLGGPSDPFIEGDQP